MTAAIHPFPARMAPELALQALAAVPENGLVVDPMMGSGTVIRHASDLGLTAVGFDVDPLAVLMSRVWTTPLDDTVVGRVYEAAAAAAKSASTDALALPWIDDDAETQAFISYWFGKTQTEALRCWAHTLNALEALASPEERAALDVIRVALSRIIVSKEQCASLARDTSHSRPHRVTLTSDYCVHQGLARSVKMVRNRLKVAPPKAGAQVGLGDARALTLADASADAVLTSPPYLNAIDYMRGHRMSLVWLGHRLSDLRRIRSDAIGAERGLDAEIAVREEVKAALGDLTDLPGRRRGMVDRYVVDAVGLAREIKRVLKPGGVTTLVVGNSCLKQVFIKNSAAVAKALELEGLNFVSEEERALPSSSRYLPTSEGSSLANRMRTETVLKWAA